MPAPLVQFQHLLFSMHRYISAWFAYERNASAYVNKVVEWRDNHGMNGVYSDGLPEDEWLVAYVLALVYRAACVRVQRTMPCPDWLVVYVRMLLFCQVEWCTLCICIYHKGAVAFVGPLGRICLHTHLIFIHRAIPSLSTHRASLMSRGRADL
jgi:hypothetical protein